MPITCEVCGNVEQSAETAAIQENLHICADCMVDRRLPELPDAED